MNPHHTEISQRIELNLPDLGQLFNTLGVLRESQTIGGWVAMWRPMEIYFYEWWPVKQHGKVLQKLIEVPVEVKQRLKQPG